MLILLLATRHFYLLNPDFRRHLYLYQVQVKTQIFFPSLEKRFYQHPPAFICAQFFETASQMAGVLSIVV
jgi:hypothetical protein